MTIRSKNDKIIRITVKTPIKKIVYEQTYRAKSIRQAIRMLKRENSDKLTIMEIKVEPYTYEN